MHFDIGPFPGARVGDGGACLFVRARARVRTPRLGSVLVVHARAALRDEAVAVARERYPRLGTGEADPIGRARCAPAPREAAPLRRAVRRLRARRRTAAEELGRNGGVDGGLAQPLGGRHVNHDGPPIAAARHGARRVCVPRRRGLLRSAAVADARGRYPPRTRRRRKGAQATNARPRIKRPTRARPAAGRASRRAGLRVRARARGRAGGDRARATRERSRCAARAARRLPHARRRSPRLSSREAQQSALGSAHPRVPPRAPAAAAALLRPSALGASRTPPITANESWTLKIKPLNRNEFKTLTPRELERARRAAGGALSESGTGNRGGAGRGGAACARARTHTGARRRRWALPRVGISVCPSVCLSVSLSLACERARRLAREAPHDRARGARSRHRGRASASVCGVVRGVGAAGVLILAVRKRGHGEHRGCRQAQHASLSACEEVR